MIKQTRTYNAYFEFGALSKRVTHRNAIKLFTMYSHLNNSLLVHSTYFSHIFSPRVYSFHLSARL